MYKRAEDGAEFIGPKDPETGSFKIEEGTHLVNVLALQGKFGLVYIPHGFPGIDLYVGLGVRGYFNHFKDLPENYRGSTHGDFIFGRPEGMVVLPSAIIGLNLGIGVWKNP